MKLSITRAWDEASVFVRQEAGPDQRVGGVVLLLLARARSED